MFCCCHAFGKSVKIASIANNQHMREHLATCTGCCFRQRFVSSHDPEGVSNNRKRLLKGHRERIA